MKATFHRYSEVNSFRVRGPISEKEWGVLKFGFHHLAKDLESPLLINLLNAEVPEEILNDMIEFKKTIKDVTAHEIHIVSKDKRIADFLKLDQFYLKNQSKPMRQIVDRLIIEDQAYELEIETIAIDEQLKTMGFDKAAAKLEIRKNTMAKLQKKSLDGFLKWQKQRKLNFKAVPCEVADLETNLQAASDEVTKIMEQPIDL
jgi:hypothetical protein